MNIFHHDLETVKEPCFMNLNLTHEIYSEIFIHNTVACREKCEDMRYKMLFAGVEIFPVLQVVGEVDLFRGPETGLMLFVHFPDAGVIDGEDNKPVLVLP